LVTKFHNGEIYLGNSTFTDVLYVSADGLVVEQETFESSSEKHQVDLAGKFLSPAFRDGHAHPLFAGREARGLDISNCLTEHDLITTLSNYASGNPALDWIDAAVFDRSLNMRFHRETLDRAIPDKPVVLHGDDHHTLWVNTKALEAAGLMNGQLPTLEAGSVDVDESGIPTGILREWQAMSLVMDLAPKLSQEQDVQALVWSDKALAASGIVECVDAWIDRGMAETYLAAWKTGNLNIDYTLCFRADPASFSEDINYFLEMREALEVTQGQIKGTSIKFFADGVLGSQTALVSEPYLNSDHHGEATWQLDEFKAAIALAHENGFQIHVHSIGDAATELTLDVLEELKDFSYPPIIAHAELTNQSLLNRMAELGVVACVQPYWAQNNGLLLSCLTQLGSNRLDSLYSFRDMFETGVLTVFSSDWPISTYDPIKGLAVAVNRKEHAHQEPHNLVQAVSVEQGITAYSKNVKLMLNASNTGTFEIGQPFDSVVMSQNPFKASDLIQTKVLATYKAGIELFRTNP
jgi:predicted amidohydrolase YtcJ